MTTTEPQTMTLRECIEAGGRGAFAKALLALYDAPTNENYSAAWKAGKPHDRSALAQAATRYSRDNMVWEFAIEAEFPGLRKLDEPCADPHAIPLRRKGE